MNVNIVNNIDKNKELKNKIRLLIKSNIKFFDEILEKNILKVFKDKHIVISDKNLREDMIIIAKEVYFAG